MNKYEMECVLRSAYYEVLDKLQIEDGEPEIEFVETMKDKYATGCYIRNKNMIVVKIQDIEDMVETICHEARHAWQYKRYGDYYVRTYAELDLEDFDAYWECEFEVDAREYAEANYKEVYKIAMENNSYLFE